MSKSLLPIFSSRSFTVSGLIFKSLIYFEFIFVYGIRKQSSFIFLHLFSFPNTTYWRDYLYPIVCSCLPCYILFDHLGVGLFMGSLFCSIDLHICFCTILFWLPYLCSIVWNQGVWYLLLRSSFSKLPWLFKVFCGSIQILGLVVLVLRRMPLIFS